MVRATSRGSPIADCLKTWGFPKDRGTILRVPKIRLPLPVEGHAGCPHGHMPQDTNSSEFTFDYRASQEVQRKPRLSPLPPADSGHKG